MDSQIQTVRCRRCGKPHYFDMEGFRAFQAGTPVQTAFPNSSAGDRAVLLSGWCGPCFDEVLGPEEED